LRIVAQADAMAVHHTPASVPATTPHPDGRRNEERQVAIRDPLDGSAEAILAASQRLPHVDLTELRRDPDAIIDPAIPHVAAD
jgi:hypothetical protein